MRGGDGQAAVVGDADLDARAAVVTEEPDSGSPHGTGKDLDAPAREADAGAVEALDHRLLGRPPTGQAFGAAVAVGDLGGGVDLGQEGRPGALDGERDAVDGHGVNTDALHADKGSEVTGRGP